jgi:RNA polymerase sigma factor (TIGR02999 family)
MPDGIVKATHLTHQPTFNLHYYLPFGAVVATAIFRIREFLSHCFSPMTASVGTADSDCDAISTSEQASCRIDAAVASMRSVVPGAKRPVNPMIEADQTVSLLHAVARGEAGALDRLIPYVYAELRQLASRQLRRLGGTPTVSTTVLVHEAYERLIGHSALSIEDERHFYALCGRVMRQIIIDHARERVAEKRGGGIIVVTLDDALGGGSDDVELSARLTEALSQLAERDAALAELAEMAWFAGLDTEHIARLTGVHLRQVQRDLKRARAWIATAVAP